MAPKTKATSSHDLIRTLFLALLLHFWLQNQNKKFLCLDKIFVLYSFAWFMAKNFETEIFWDLLKTLLLVLLLHLWLQNPKPQVCITWQDVCSCYFVYSYEINNRVLITKAELTKLLENILDKRAQSLEICPTKTLGCLTKSLLS